MRPVLPAVVLALLLTGCAAVDRQYAARDDSRCQSYGFAPGSQHYGLCRMVLDQGRTGNGEENWAMLALGAAALMQPAAPAPVGAGRPQ